MGTTQQLRDLAGPALASTGLELWDVEISHDVVRILVDRPGGVDLDALSDASRIISPLLDAHPEAVPGGRYQLEVSSPGVERTLRTLDQYNRYVGSEVTVKTKAPIDGARRHHGTLLAADADAIRLRPNDTPEGTVLELRHDQIDRVRTVLVWGPSAPPSSPSRRRPSHTATPRAATAPKAKDSRS